MHVNKHFIVGDLVHAVQLATDLTFAVDGLITSSSREQLTSLEAHATEDSRSSKLPASGVHDVYC